MRAIVKAVLRWPMYSIPRLVGTVVALVALFLVAQQFGDSGEPPAPAAPTAITSDGGGASDGGASDSGGGTEDGAQATAGQAVRAYVTRDSPADLVWVQALRPYATSEVMQTLQEQTWQGAGAAPLTVASVAPRDASDGGQSAATSWQGDVDVTAVDGNGQEHVFTFRVQMDRSDDGWKLTKLDEVTA